MLSVIGKALHIQTALRGEGPQEGAIFICSSTQRNDLYLQIFVSLFLGFFIPWHHYNNFQNRHTSHSGSPSASSCPEMGSYWEPTGDIRHGYLPAAFQSVPDGEE
jgi:hypothetical protein